MFYCIRRSKTNSSSDVEILARFPISPVSSLTSSRFEICVQKLISQAVRSNRDFNSKKAVEEKRQSVVSILLII